MRAPRVLIACEESGQVRRAMRAMGINAYSCDILPARDKSIFHLQRDVRDVLRLGHIWDLMIAHPPCTRLANSGVRWLNERSLWDELDEAAAFFKLLLDADIPRIAVENPIPHKYAVERIGRKYDQIIQPWQFGHGEQKATCLWLKNLPPLTPTNIVAGREQRIWKMGPSADRAMLRSETYPGIAAAMAAQWGGLLLP